jgi:hypothetical protein
VGLLSDGDRLQSTQRRSLPRSLGAQRSMLIRQSNRFVDAEEKFHLEISVLWCCWGEWNSRPRHYQCVFQTLGLGWMRIDEVVSGSITDCFIWTFRRVGFACCRTWLVSVVLRSPTNPLLVTPPRRRESRQAARQPLPFRRSWRVTSSGLISAKRNLTVVQFIRSRGGKRKFAAIASCQ